MVVVFSWLYTLSTGPIYLRWTWPGLASGVLRFLGNKKGFPEEGMGANRDCESGCSALRWTVTHVR